jgi:predicted esterase YcpF (UPF0227 family)
MNKTILYYVHGYKTKPEKIKSRKFRNLNSFFGEKFNYGYMSWNENSDFDKLLDKALEQTRDYNKVILIGDSTGANFAYQIRQYIKERKQNVKLILTSPLLDVKKRLRDIPFTGNLLRALLKINSPKDCLIIATNEDEVLEQKWIFENKFNNVKVINVNDNHRLEKFQNYIKEIEEYIK